MDKWIKCSDRLPEFREGAKDHEMMVECLVTIQQRDGLRTIYAEYERNMYAATERGRAPRWTWLGKKMPWEPIHWMPLPEPPTNGDAHE